MELATLLPCIVVPNVNGAAVVAGTVAPYDGTDGADGMDGTDGADPNRLLAGAVTLLATVDAGPNAVEEAPANIDVDPFAVEEAPANIDVDATALGLAANIDVDPTALGLAANIDVDPTALGLAVLAPPIAPPVGPVGLADTGAPLKPSAVFVTGSIPVVVFVTADEVIGAGVPPRLNPIELVVTATGVAVLIDAPPKLKPPVLGTPLTPLAVVVDATAAGVAILFILFDAAPRVKPPA